MRVRVVRRDSDVPFVPSVARVNTAAWTGMAVPSSAYTHTTSWFPVAVTWNTSRSASALS